MRSLLENIRLAEAMQARGKIDSQRSLWQAILEIQQRREEVRIMNGSNGFNKERSGVKQKNAGRDPRPPGWGAQCDPGPTTAEEVLGVVAEQTRYQELGGSPAIAPSDQTRGLGGDSRREYRGPIVRIGRISFIPGPLSHR